MEKKSAIYANSFAISINKDTNEAAFAFLQKQPGYNPKTDVIDDSTPLEVATVLIPYVLLEKMVEILPGLIADHEASRIIAGAKHDEQGEK